LREKKIIQKSSVARLEHSPGCLPGAVQGTGEEKHGGGPRPGGGKGFFWLLSKTTSKKRLGGLTGRVSGNAPSEEKETLTVDLLFG